MTTATTSSPLPNAAAPTPSNAPAKPCRNSAKPASGAPSRRSPPTPASPAHGCMPRPNCATNSARLTAISETPEPAPARIERGSDASLRQRLTLAHERIRELDDENHQLRNQIALLHGQLRANRIAGTHVTDTVHDTNPQLTPLNSQPSPR